MLLQLFFSFLTIGAFSFGGGLAALPLIQYQVVKLHQWMSITEFTDLISIAEMTPGPIAINSATFVGMRLGSFPGAIIATLGCLIPSILFVTLLGILYFKYKELDWMKGVLAGLRPDSQRYFDHHHAANDTFDAVNKRELELGAATMTSLIYLFDKYGTSTINNINEIKD